MRRISFTARTAQEAQHSAEVEVLLVIIEHPDVEGGILRLCSDPKTRIPGTNPPLYATYSTWRTDDGSPFIAAPLEGLLPDEKDDAPTQASLVIPILDSEMGAMLTSTTVPATCHMAAVMSSSPNLLEGEWLSMKATGADVDAMEAAIRFSTESLYDEPASADRMIKEKFPGLHR